MASRIESSNHRWTSSSAACSSNALDPTRYSIAVGRAKEQDADLQRRVETPRLPDIGGFAVDTVPIPTLTLIANEPKARCSSPWRRRRCLPSHERHSLFGSALRGQTADRDVSGTVCCSQRFTEGYPQRSLTVGTRSRVNPTRGTVRDECQITGPLAPTYTPIWQSPLLRDNDSHPSHRRRANCC
jgi:hypothetical protein